MYDICIIGGGPGGYVAAIKAARLGAKVALIEKDLLGGTCLNKGCIPTKILAHTAHTLLEIKDCAKLGINVGSVSYDFKNIIAQKDQTVDKLRNGIDFLLKTRQVDIIKASAEIVGKTQVRAGERSINAKNIIIATGSRPQELSFLRFDGKRVISSDDILKLENPPKSLLIIGAGVIGCEYASIFSEFGTKISMVDMMPRILPTMDKEISRKLEVIFKKKGISMTLNAKVDKLDDEIDKALVCVGRRANIEGIGLENVGVKTQDGTIIVDKHLRTNIENIYAIGDVVGKYWLAHVASYEAMIAIENILGAPKDTDYTAVPSCIFTDPEIASVGIDEDQAKDRGLQVKIGKFPFQALGRAQTVKETEGFVKIISDARSGVILGAQVMGCRASDLIAELSLAVNKKLTAQDIEDTIHAHPSFPEAVSEAAASIFHGAIHLP